MVTVGGLRGKKEGRKRQPRICHPHVSMQPLQEFQVSCEDLPINPGLNQGGLDQIINCLGSKLVFFLEAKSRPAGRDQNQREKGETPVLDF